MADPPKPPPNLRVASDESRECDTCKYDERGKCTLYSNLPVDDEWVCDDWVKGSVPDKDSDAPIPVSQQARTTREASVRVREHFRRARQQQQSSSTK